MEEMLAALEKAFDDYGTDLEKAAKKQKVTDGLFGFGHSLKDDACHDRLDEKVSETVSDIIKRGPSPGEAERAVRTLLASREERFPREAARWMLRAVERHALKLIPFLDRSAAGKIMSEYTRRYRPWDRLPAQKEVLRALGERARGEK